jgi:hypothetical protein
VDDLGLRLVLLANAVIPFVFFMAAVYLALHIAFSRLVHSPDSPLIWFFAVVTGPLTRPVRAWLAPGTPEPRVRLLALGLYTVLWLVSRTVLLWLGTTYRG